MHKIEKLNLIKGQFSAEDAREILLNIFSYKIAFHQLKKVSVQERFGEEDHHSDHRIIALKKEIEKLGAILSEAERSGMYLSINTEINIELISTLDA